MGDYYNFMRGGLFILSEQTQVLSNILFHDNMLGYDKLNRINENYSYPNETEYEYFASLLRIDFDDECQRDLQTGEGFIISSPKTTIKKDIKDPNGIFSTKFGQKLGDLNPFIDRYSCECGELKSKSNNGRICPKCHKICKYVSDDYKMFGWIKLIDKYPIIHPDIYRSIDSLLGRSKYDKRSKNKSKGSKLRNILDFDTGIDVNGHVSTEDISKQDEPFFGKGFLFFIDNFDMIMDYYVTKYPKKKYIYDDIMLDRKRVFIHSIPVYTTHLRPMDISANSMYFEKCSAMYNIMVRLANLINKDKTHNDRLPKTKSQAMYNLQMKYNELYDEILSIMSGKRGVLRSLIGGRYSFSSRSVIRQDPSLRIDQIRLPYVALVIMLKGQIENILHRQYNITYQEAYNKWYNAQAEFDPIIGQIIDSLIANGFPNPETGESEGLPMITNRNPSMVILDIMKFLLLYIHMSKGLYVYNCQGSIVALVTPYIYKRNYGKAL